MKDKIIGDNGDLLLTLGEERCKLVLEAAEWLQCNKNLDGLVSSEQDTRMKNYKDNLERGK